MRQQQFIEVDHQGQTIRGVAYLPAAAGRRPAVLMLHGFTGQRTESGFMFVQLGRALADAGVAAVAFDFINSGESDGSFEKMLVTRELADAMRMSRWLSGQPFVDRQRMGMIGFSLGGMLAACVSGRFDGYRAMALIAPTTAANMARHARNVAVGQRVAIGPHVMQPAFFEDMLRLDPVADITRRPLPTLIMQGQEDTAVPPEVSAEFAAALESAGQPATVELVPDAGHTFGTPETRSRLIQSVVTWLTQAL